MVPLLGYHWLHPRSRHGLIGVFSAQLTGPPQMLETNGKSELLVSRLPSSEAEIFSSIQGEGKSLGLPSTFVRLAACNLRCIWCDTAYTWDWARHNRLARTASLSVDDVAARVVEKSTRNVVVTGGEPLLQGAPLASLAEELTRAGRRIEIETNGTIPPDDRLVELVAQWNVSPKLRNSGEPLARRINDAALQVFASTPSAYFKFVICDLRDVDESAALVRSLRIPPERVYLMPEGTSADVVLERLEMLVDAAAPYGFNVTPRLHILLWGDVAGR